VKARILRAFQNSQAVSWVQETKTKRLIGFARATGDKVFHALISDIMVDPAYQGRGLGKVVMKRLMADLFKTGASFICLHTKPTVVGFYQRLGFIARDDIRVMSV
jgi:ribosomal protein S18 acetylase RimI-like enzyme